MTLPEYIAANLSRPFQWGEQDCVLFAARWVEIKTGRNHLAMFPAWSSAKTALRIVRQVGGLQAALDARFARVHPNLARDGDLALYDRSLCIMSGAHAVGAGVQGLMFIDRTKVLCAWSL